MFKRNMLATIVLAMAATMFLASPGFASASGFVNADCLGCHSEMKFSVASVNYNTACKKCHYSTLVGTHPYHNPTGNCGAVCHPTWGDSIASSVPFYNDPAGAGAFATASSKSTSPALLHIIHSNPRWMDGLSAGGSKCGSCHAVAACTACHEDPAMDTTHKDHASTIVTFAPDVTPWTGYQGSGVPNGDQSYDSRSAVSNRCGGSRCHDISGTASSAPGRQDSFSHPADPVRGYLANTVTTSGKWTSHFANVYSGGQEVVSNAANAWFQTSFSGSQVVLVADKDPYRGIGEVLIDGVSAGNVDFYNGTTVNQEDVWTSGQLTSGTHTIRVRATGTQNASARGAWVSVDQFKVYAAAPGSVAPDCSGCHPDRAAYHGSKTTFGHTATTTAGDMYNGGTGNYRCDSCHAMDVRTEHGRTSSSTSADSCTACHTTYAPFHQTGAWTTADASPQGACAGYGCHAAAPNQAHANIATGHATTTDPNEKICRDCHTGDLAAIHNNSITTNPWVTNCNTCHTPTKFPATKSCTDASCHAVSGVTSFAAHTFNVLPHTATPFTSAAQGGTTTVDAGGLECSACHTSRLDTAHATTSKGAISCSTGGAGNVGCHLGNYLNSSNVVAGGWATGKCIECHNSGSNRSHDSTQSAHTVPAGACAGTDTGCHPSTNLWVIHNTYQDGSKARFNRCANAGCHDASNVNKVPAITSCGSGSGGCHQDIVNTFHPVRRNHIFTDASAYSATTETGCTNSGANCHGADVTHEDMSAEYHNDPGCLTGVCHLSSSYNTYKTQNFANNTAYNNDCVTCHSGTYASSPRRAPLTGVYPNGHYSETTHTATGTNFSATVKGTAGGTATATCTNCHNPTLTSPNGLYAQHQNITPVAGSPYGSSINCGECHNDTRSYGSIESSMAVKWTNNKCEDCHKVGGTSPMHGTVAPSVLDTQTISCGASGANCHTSKDLHVIHQNAAGGCGLTDSSGAKCHDFTKQAFVPTAQSCGAGGACHTTYNMNTAIPTHTKSMETTDHAPTSGNLVQANMTFQGYTCTSCHIVTKADGGLIAEHGLATASMTTVPGNVCRNCHNNPSSYVASSIATGWGAPNNFKDTGGACSSCHFAPGLLMHTDAAPAKHTKTGASPGCGNSGPGCHPTDDLSQVGTPSTTANLHSTCLRCHDRTASGGNYAYNPANYTCGSGRACHNTAGQYNTSTGVHNGLLGLIDGNDAAHHTVDAGYFASTVSSGTATNLCSDCHLGTLASEHATTSIGAVSCTTGGSSGKGCHNTTTGSVAASSSVVVKNSWPTKRCDECHDGAIHNTMNSSHDGTSTESCGNTGAGCHTTSNLIMLHKGRADGCRLNGCHDATNKSQRPTKKSCGGATGTCHTGYLVNGYHGVHTGNETTHSVTATYAAALVDTGTAQISCSTNGCHQTGMTAEHSTVTTGYYTPQATMNCQNCHNATKPPTSVNATSVVKSNSWNHTCEACHPAKSVEHSSTLAGGTSGRHSITDTQTSDGTACGTSGCHPGFAANIAQTHSIATTVVAGTTYNSCQVCHRGSVDSSLTVLFGKTRATWDCLACHADRKSPHIPDHNANVAAGTQVGTISGTYYAAGTNAGCFDGSAQGGCHYQDLRLEHSLSSYVQTGYPGANRSMDGTRGSNPSGCTVCHASMGTTPGAYASRTAIVNAVAKGDMRCTSCHFENSDAAGTTGVKKPHASNLPNGQSSTPTGTTYEFQNWAQGGGHNAMGTAFPKTLANQSVNGVTIGTLSFPGSGLFQTGWTSTSPVLCDDCHLTPVPAAGPQGATVPFYVMNSAGSIVTTDGGSATPWYKNTISGFNSSMCVRCHKAPTNGTHSTGQHSGYTCDECHIRIPHAWKRPRLLRRTAAAGGSTTEPPDAMPYADPTQASWLVGYTVTSGQTGFSTRSSCKASCYSSHSGATPYWP